LLTILANGLVRRRRLVLLVTGVLLVLAAVIAAPAMNVLSNGGFRDPHSESARANALLETKFGTGDVNYVLLADAPGGVDAPDSVAAGRDLARRLADEPGVTRVNSYWDLPNPSMRSQDGTQALILAHLAGDEDAAMRTARRLHPQFTGAHAPLTLRDGGESVMNFEGDDRIKEDLAKAESVAVPLTLLILIVVFGSIAAALLPLVIATISIMGALAVLRLLALVTNVSVFSVNLTTALGLGLAIDYSLFMVSRFREELRNGAEVKAAVRTTVATAGRTVIFSAITVLISLAALLVFPLYFLRSFAYAGIAAVAFAALGAVVVLPAVLALLGRRVDALRVGRLWSRWGRSRKRIRREEAGFWHRLAVLVMRRPIPIALGAVAVMLLLAAPSMRLSVGLPDDRVMPASTSAAQVGGAIRGNFDDRSADAMQILLLDSGTDPAAIRDYLQRLSRIPGVDVVFGAGGTSRDGQLVSPDPAQPGSYQAGADARLVLLSRVEPFSGAGQDLVREIRRTPAPASKAMVSGTAAAYTDTMAGLYSSAPWALLIVIIVTACLLFLFTGGVLVPVIAIILNSLVLTATVGVLVWIFQDGHLGWLTGPYTHSGRLDVTMPILMVCVLFGLSMDYEVFLLSRIKEEYDRNGDNRAAVALGLERIGRIVTAAAGLLAIVFIALLTSGFTHVKTLALGTAFAVVLDATVVRGLLVPAFMRLAGRYNWWAPRPLRWVHRRFGINPEAEPFPGSVLSRPLAPAVPLVRQRPSPDLNDPETAWRQADLERRATK
jgi:RND superfamily putative drug exporter